MAALMAVHFVTLVKDLLGVGILTRIECESTNFIDNRRGFDN